MKTTLTTALFAAALIMAGCSQKPADETTKASVAVEANTTTPVPEANTSAVPQAPAPAHESPSPAPAAKPAPKPKPEGQANASGPDAASLFASKCASCHGAKGEGKAPMFPKLAGQGQEAIAQKLHGYRDGSYGKEKKGMMIPNAKGLSEAQIDLLASYIGTL